MPTDIGWIFRRRRQIFIATLRHMMLPDIIELLLIDYDITLSDREKERWLLIRLLFIAAAAMMLPCWYTSFFITTDAMPCWRCWFSLLHAFLFDCLDADYFTLCCWCFRHADCRAFLWYADADWRWYAAALFHMLSPPLTPPAMPSPLIAAADYWPHADFRRWLIVIYWLLRNRSQNITNAFRHLRRPLLWCWLANSRIV